MPIKDDAALTLHFAPRTRAMTALWGLEELGVDYRIDAFDLASGRHRQPEYLAVNPMGKVPAVVDASFEGEPVACAETGAILVWLGDRYGSAELVPSADDPARAAYLRWMFFAGSVFEPALAQFFFKWEVSSSTVAWGSFERMMQALEAGVAQGPWLLGERFTLADVAVGAGAGFGLQFGALPKEGPVAEYVARCGARAAFTRAQAIAAEISSELQAADEGAVDAG